MVYEFAVYELEIAIYALFGKAATLGDGRTFGVVYGNQDFQTVEFERCKGKQFDPKIADIMISLIKKDELNVDA